MRKLGFSTNNYGDWHSMEDQAIGKTGLDLCERLADSCQQRVSRQVIVRKRGMADVRR